MKSLQATLKAKSDVIAEMKKLNAIEPQLVLAFGTHEAFVNGGQAQAVSAQFPNAIVIGCSTAGEIANAGVFDNTLIVTASHFAKPSFKAVSTEIKSMDDTAEAGRRFAKQLDKKDLRSIFVLGRGLEINGSALIEGIREVVGTEVIITGGLAGDAGRFKQTFTLLNGKVADNQIVGFGIYGDEVQVSYGSLGGWEQFGPIRKVTKSKENVLFELDGKPALEIYKKYLGDKADQLPASALLFPFALLKDNQDSSGLVRTILAVNEEDQSVTFAGDIPVNGLVRLMHTSNDGLVSGAKGAAELVMKKEMKEEGLGILVSCVGRKLVLGGDVEEELDAVRDVFGQSTVAGFYSYGEICPQEGALECKLHNQTMTITYLSEKKAA